MQIKGIVSIICIFFILNFELIANQIKTVSISVVRVDSTNSEILENYYILDFDSLGRNTICFSIEGTNKWVDYYSISNTDSSSLSWLRYEIDNKVFESKSAVAYLPIIGLNGYWGNNIQYFNCSDSSLGRCTYNQLGQIEEYFYTENGIKKKRLFYYTYY